MIQIKFYNMIATAKKKSVGQQFWVFMCSEGLPCLFVLLMLFNTLFFTYIVLKVNQVNLFDRTAHAMSPLVVSDAESKHHPK